MQYNKLNLNVMNPFPRMHVSLYVSDMQKTIDFYNTFFGIAPEKVRRGYVKYILPEPSLRAIHLKSAHS